MFPQPTQLASILATEWTDLDECAKGTWARKAIKDFEDNTKTQDQEAVKGPPKAKKSKQGTVRGKPSAQELGELKGRIMQYVEDAESTKVTIDDVRAKLLRSFGETFLNHNKSTVRTYLRDAVSAAGEIRKSH